MRSNVNGKLKSAEVLRSQTPPSTITSAAEVLQPPYYLSATNHQFCATSLICECG
jgi:hypothetical protein